MDKWTPETLARFVAVNGYDPTTEAGLITHIDQVIAALNTAVDRVESWNGRTDITVEEGIAGVARDMETVRQLGVQLTEAKAMLGEWVYKRAKGLTDA
jgi:hypothetical protein